MDCRLLPSTSPEAFLAELKATLADPGLSVDVLLDARGGPASQTGPL